MKTARLLFVVMGFGAFTLGRGLADEPSKLPSGQAARQNHDGNIHPAEPEHGSGAQTDKIHSLLNNNNLARLPERNSLTGPLHIPPKSASVTEFHPPAFKKTAAAAKEGPTMNKTASEHEQLAKLPVGRATALPVSGFVHGRSTAAASLGGATAASAKTPATAALDGAAIKRKP